MVLGLALGLDDRLGQAPGHGARKGVAVRGRRWGRPPGTPNAREWEKAPFPGTSDRIAREVAEGARCQFCWLLVEGKPCDCRRAACLRASVVNTEAS